MRGACKIKLSKYSPQVWYLSSLPSDTPCLSPCLVLSPDLSWWAALLDTHPSQAGGAHQGHLLSISADGLAELTWGEGGDFV